MVPEMQTNDESIRERASNWLRIVGKKESKQRLESAKGRDDAYTTLDAKRGGFSH